MLIIQVYVCYSSFADLPFVGWEMQVAPYIEGLSMSAFALSMSAFDCLCQSEVVYQSLPYGGG